MAPGQNDALLSIYGRLVCVHVDTSDNTCVCTGDMHRPKQVLGADGVVTVEATVPRLRSALHPESHTSENLQTDLSSV